MAKNMSRRGDLRILDKTDRMNIYVVPGANASQWEAQQLWFSSLINTRTRSQAMEGMLKKKLKSPTLSFNLRKRLQKNVIEHSSSAKMEVHEWGMMLVPNQFYSESD